MSDYFNLIAARIFYFNSGRIYFHQNKSIYLINVLHAVIGFMLAVKFLLAVSWEVNNSAGWLQLIQCGQLFLTACGSVISFAFHSYLRVFLACFSFVFL